MCSRCLKSKSSLSIRHMLKLRCMTRSHAIHTQSSLLLAANRREAIGRSSLPEHGLGAHYGILLRNPCPSKFEILDSDPILRGPQKGLCNAPRLRKVPATNSFAYILQYGRPFLASRSVFGFQFSGLHKQPSCLLPTDRFPRCRLSEGSRR